MRAGFAGLGAMGLPMARNLHRAGLLTGIWNRTASKAADLAVELGVSHFGGAAELAAQCDAVVTCVSADDAVLEVLAAIAPAMPDDGIVIDCSTTSPRTAREAAALAQRDGVHFLDCPVSGGTEGAKQGSLAIVVGGDEGAARRARPVLEAMGGSISYMGPTGAGQASKAVNQIMVAGINQAVSEAMALAQAESLPLEKLIEVLGTGAAASWFLTHRGPNMVRDSYPLGFKVALHQKDLEICRLVAGEHGVQLPVVEMTLLHYRRLLETAGEPEDISSLFRLKRALFNQAGGSPAAD